MGEGCIQDVIGAPLKDAFQALLPSVQGLQVAAADTSLQCFRVASKLQVAAVGSSSQCFRWALKLQVATADSTPQCSKWA